MAFCHFTVNSNVYITVAKLSFPSKLLAALMKMKPLLLVHARVRFTVQFNKTTCEARTISCFMS